jgi:hypothetical protein
LFPESFYDLEKLFLLDDSVEVDSIHGQKVLALLGRELVEIVFRLDLVQTDQTLAGESA